MSYAHRPDGAVRRSAAEWVGLAAAPAFAAMALLTGLASPPAVLCSAASPLTGMVPMYLLMSAVHSGPWLKLIASRRDRPHPS